MTINLNMPHPEPDLKPKITVVGVGGAGGNAVNNMIENGLGGVEFVVTNTDAQALAQSKSERTIQLGRNITQGLGAGSRPDVGKAAAEEAIEDIIEHIQQSNMVFITAGMGGGTGTGAAPVVARASREQGILTVGVVTKPFQFEGLNRMRIAEEGMEELQHYVDTLIIIPNQNLFRIANEKTTFAQAFEMADDVLHSGVRGVTDLMVMPGLINLDFADVRQVMSEMGKAMMGTGEAEDDNRAITAAESAISNPLLDDVSMEGARGVLINITGGYDMTLFEVDEAANRIRSEVDAEANIIFGSTFDESLEGRMRISVIATGIDAQASVQPAPLTQHISLVSDNTAMTEETGQSEAPAAAPQRFTPPNLGRFRKLSDNAKVAEEPPILSLDATAAVSAKDLSMEPDMSAAPETASQPADDSFLPPPPVEAPESIEQADPGPAAKPYPMAEADMVNAGSQAPKSTPSRRKGPSLFERVTGTGRARAQKSEPKPAPAAETKAAPAAPPAIKAPEHELPPVLPPAPEPRLETTPAAQEPRLDATPTTPAPAAPAPQASVESPPAPTLEAPPAEPTPRQGALGEPEQPSPAPQQHDLSGLEHKGTMDKDVEEDLLEIPAFLRRQAN
jgi:cell division protein FtsZ